MSSSAYKKYGLSLDDFNQLLKEHKKCAYCGILLKDRKGSSGSQSGARTIEHLNHRGNSGKYVVLCCGSCNSSRGDRPLLKWFESDYCERKHINLKNSHSLVKEYARKHERDSK